MVYRIPLNKPFLAGDEMRYIAESISLGQISGDGSFTRRCHRRLEQQLGAARVLLTTSCTHALEMAALLLNVGPGDEVILPSFTFVSTANAFALRGARPVFADIRPDTLNLNETALEQLVTPRTRAVVPVHYAGVGCEMDAIMNIAERHGVSVVEDNAHGLFARYKGRHLGTIGCLGAQSFHETKNIICGEGGALVINDAAFIERAEIIREKGTNRSRFFRGQVDKYTWVDVGSSYLPSDLLAAFLCAQLEKSAEIYCIRRRIWHTYVEQLKNWAEQRGVRLPVVPEECEQSYHMFYLILPTPEVRDGFIQHLKTQSIMAAFHYVPLHLSEMGQKLGGRLGQCPVTEYVSERLVRLPFYNGLTEQEQAEVIDAVKGFGGCA
jgi:dTDP-4-amino-4,6-dideoxygalactose transaminase